MEREPTQEELDYQDDFFELLDEVSQRLLCISKECNFTPRARKDMYA